jgi:thiol-disulfide isomerase/thioredoxin
MASVVGLVLRQNTVSLIHLDDAYGQPLALNSHASPVAGRSQTLMDVLVIVACRFLLSVMFLIAGASKLLNGFANSRKALGEFGVPTFLVKPFGIALPFAELTIGCLLLLSSSALLGAIAAFSALVIFNAAIATNLALGKHPSCNCFGQLHSEPIGWKTFARNSVLAGVAGALAWSLHLYPSQSIWPLIRSLSSTQIGWAVIAIIGTIGFALEGFLVLHLFRQNGRLLLRIEALEARPVAGNQPASVRPVPFVGLPIGSKAIPFDLPNTKGGRATLDSLLSGAKPLLLISTDPNCGPCNSLMPEVAVWQEKMAGELTIALLSHGRFSDNQKKAAEFGLKNVLVEKKHEIAEKYQALGTPTGVLIRSDGTIGSPAMGGADAIRQLLTTRAWTEAGFVAFMAARALPPPPAPPKPTLPVGSPVPAFALPDLDETVVESVSFNGNGTVLLFWNPGCGFCQKMIPQLKEWEQNKPSTAPRLVLVSGGSRDANRAMGFESTVLLDDKFAVGQSCGASGTPSGVLIDAKGKIASTLVVGAPGVMSLLSGDNVASALEKISVARAGSSH